MLRLVCFALLVACASAGRIAFSNCGSAGTPTYIDVEDCNAAPCSLVKGRSYNIETGFRSRDHSDTLSVNVVGKVSIITVPIVDKDACEGLTGGCPYRGGQGHTHNIRINISQELIETSAKVELRLKTKEGGTEICVSADVRIVSG